MFCTRYLDQVVAKLPFEANFWLIAKVTHRGLKFPKANDCAVVSTIAAPFNTACRMCLQSVSCSVPSIHSLVAIETMTQLVHTHSFTGNSCDSSLYWLAIAFIPKICSAARHQHFCGTKPSVLLVIEILLTCCIVLQTFIYVLCQTGIRMNLQQFLMWGPSRAMQDMTSWQQVADEAK